MVVVVKKCKVKSGMIRKLRALATNAARKLHILRQNGDALGVDGAKIGILEKTNEVSLSSLLKSANSCALEANVSLEVLGDFTNETREGELADEKLSGFLKAANFAQSNNAGAKAMGLLNASSTWKALASLRGQLLARLGFLNMLAGSLFGASHDDKILNRRKIKIVDANKNQASYDGMKNT